MTINLVNPHTPDAVDIDFTSTEGASRVVEGTYADLIMDGHETPSRWMCNVHADPADRKPAFLMGRGWSATLERRQAIADSGIPAMAINDYPADGPSPKYWCTGDPPHYFSERIWSNPDVMKFCGFQNRNGSRPRDGAYEPLHLAKDAPNTFFFHQSANETDTDHWLFHPYVSWGTTIGCEDGPRQFYSRGAARSSMLIGLRLLWHLGYRKVYLLGCDCTPHHHPAPAYWETIFHLIGQLKPAFDRWGYSVYQTNRDSHLRTFEFADLDDVIQ